MKPCTTCKHKVSSIFTVVFKQFMECKHPSIPANPVSGATGIDFCSIQRSPGRGCGSEGKYHETK